MQEHINLISSVLQLYLLIRNDGSNVYSMHFHLEKKNDFVGDKGIIPFVEKMLTVNVTDNDIAAQSTNKDVVQLLVDKIEEQRICISDIYMRLFLQYKEELAVAKMGLYEATESYKTTYKAYIDLMSNSSIVAMIRHYFWLKRFEKTTSSDK